MFNKAELVMIWTAVQMARKSAQRLANREGQPQAVQEQYVKHDAALNELSIKIQKEVEKAK